MSESNKNTGIVPVDVGRLSGGLQTMFTGMSEVFGSIGAGEEAVAMISAGGTGSTGVRSEVSHKAESVPKKTATTAEPTKSGVAAKAPEPKKAEAPASTLTLSDIQKIAGTKILADRGNQEKIQKIIASFGVTKLSDLPENKYEAFMTQLTTL